jgi:hypothetical protein
MFRPAIVFFLLLAVPLRANLGESVAECVKRYGTPVGYSEANAKFPFGTVAFAAANYTLIVFLLNDHEVGARISKKDKSAFTDAEMQNIMNADTDGSPWTVTTSNDPTCLQWMRTDQATALYDKANHVLIFTSTAMKAALKSPPPVPPAKPGAGP